jgi:lipid-binding SYLF domain-containing protein
MGGWKMKGSSGSIIIVAATVVIGSALPAIAATKPGQRLLDAKAVYQELLSAPDRGVPEALRKNCSCIAVFPQVIKGAIGYGARHGQGVMSCRNEQGHWSAPTFASITGASFGLQFGAEATDLVLYFMNERGARSLITSSKITLGGKASVAAGPFGRSGEAGTDLKLNAEIYSYAKSKGLFAGISLEGARLAPNKDANTEYYGSRVTAKQLLFEHKPDKIPAEAEEFRAGLP